MYDWGDEGLTVAKSAVANLLDLAKHTIIREAEERCAISRGVDVVMALLDEAELQRLRQALDKLIPGDPERGCDER